MRSLPSGARLLELALWGAAVWGSMLTWKRLRWEPDGAEESAAVVRRRPEVAEAWDARTLTAAAPALAEKDPFRLARHASPLRFGMTAPSVTAPVPVPPKPLLVLRGVAGGSMWEAAIDGLPGRERTTVVRIGDVIGPLRVREVNARGVVITGMDTTWRLSMNAAAGAPSRTANRGNAW